MLRKMVFIAIILVLNACKTATPTMAPTESIKSIPTITSQPAPKPTSTSSPIVTPDVAANAWKVTEQAFGSLKSMFSGMCESSPRSTMTSPDQNWLAQDCSYDTFQVIKKDGSKAWKVSYKEIFGGSEYYPQNVGGISPQHWANDSQYLYFSVTHCCWDPFVMMLAETETLYRMNIHDGSYNLIRKGAFDFSFSPTERRITFIQELDSPPTIEIQDLKTGDVNTVKLNVDDTYNQAKVDVWSSDGLRLAVKTVSGITYSHKIFNNNMFSLIIIDVNNLSQKFVVKDFPTNYLEVLKWTEDDVLFFQTGDDFFAEPIVLWEYDLKTDTLLKQTSGP